jgi:predicted Zn-dependent protease
VLPYQDRFEVQADHIALRLLVRANFDPQAAVSALEDQSILFTQRPGSALSVHPATQQRLSALAKRRLAR